MLALVIGCTGCGESKKDTFPKNKPETAVDGKSGIDAVRQNAE